MKAPVIVSVFLLCSIIILPTEENSHIHPSSSFFKFIIFINIISLHSSFFLSHHHRFRMFMFFCGGMQKSQCFLCCFFFQSFQSHVTSLSCFLETLVSSLKVHISHFPTFDPNYTSCPCHLMKLLKLSFLQRSRNRSNRNSRLGVVCRLFRGSI